MRVCVLLYTYMYICCCYDVTTLKMAMKPVKLQNKRKIQQDALGKVNRVKEIRIREKDGLNRTDNSIL